MILEELGERDGCPPGVFLQSPWKWLDLEELDFAPFCKSEKARFVRWTQTTTWHRSTGRVLCRPEMEVLRVRYLRKNAAWLPSDGT
jgi:hypothetical protein